MKNAFFRRQPAEDSDLQDLKRELQLAQRELDFAYHQFNLVSDPELIDSCVYQISSVKARCNYLIRAIKEHCPDEAAGSLEGNATWT